MRLLVVGAILTLLSLVALEDPKEPPPARKRNVAEKVKLRGWGADRRGHLSGLTLGVSALPFSSAHPTSAMEAASIILHCKLSSNSSLFWGLDSF